MKKRSIGLMLLVFLCSATLVFAADQDRDRTKDQKRDGSCDLTEKAVQNLQAADQTQTQSRQQKRLKKGTGTDLMDNVGGKLLAANQDRDRTKDRKRDGSCDLTEKAAQNILAADQARDRKQDRKRDGSCQG